MRVHEIANEAVQKGRYMSRAGKDLLSNSVVIRLEHNRIALDQLLVEENSLKFFQGALEQIKPLIKKYLESGSIGKLATPRNLRILCYYMDSRELSDPAIYDSKMFVPFVRVLEANWRDGFLTPLILLILRNYGSAESHQQVSRYLSPLVWRHLVDYTGNRPVPLTVKKYVELIKDSNPTVFAEKMIALGQDWFTACDSAGIPLKMMSTAFFGIAFIEYARRTDTPTMYLEDSFLTRLETLSGTELVKCLIAIMVERYGNDASIEARLTAQAFKRIGDPMIISRWSCGTGPYSRYNEILKSARLRVLAWINRQVLDYFFEKAEMDGGRKRFWSQYAGKMHQIQIAMHWVGFLGSPSFGNRDLDQWIRTRLIRVRGTTSDIALIMQYGEWSIVEIGTHGNACYLYKKDNSLFKTLDNGIRHMSDLKRKHLPTFNYPPYDGEGRFLHHDGWEYRLRNILRNKMGL